MRPVSGFERPALQWLFVAIGVALAALVAAEAVVITRARARFEAARAAEMNARLDRQQLEIELARERRARETVSIEAARLRARAGGGAASAPPTLTLSPIASRGATPPPPSVEAPDPQQLIELRLVLPRTATGDAGPFSATLRRWSSGETIWMRGGLSKGPGAPAAVTALVTGDLLTDGSYELLLRSAAPRGDASVELASYELSVSPKKR